MVSRQFILPLAIFWLLFQPTSEVRAELVVVVNSRSGVAAMTRNEVINVFFGRNRQFFNGIEAQPVELPESHAERARFYRLLVGKDLSEISAYWSRQVFSGRMQPPAKVHSTDEVLKWVVSHPGGIGIIDLAKADARVRVVYELAP